MIEKIIAVAELQIRINIVIKNKALMGEVAVCGSVVQTIKPSPISEITKEIQTP